MKPINSTKKYPADHTHYGNSFQACLASILEVDIDKIPPFGEGAATDWDEWNAWLKKNGLMSGVLAINPRYIDINHDLLDGALIGYKVFEVEGVEKRSAVIIKRGQIIHDPDGMGQEINKIIPPGIFIGRVK